MPITTRHLSDEKQQNLARLVRQWNVTDFYHQLEEAGVHHAYVVFENGEFTLSHPQLLAPIQAFLELSQDFAHHEGIFIGREDGIPTLFFAFVHDTRRGLSQGGLRFWRYENIAEVLVDGLRLAQGMTRKNALAELWWGGGKGIIPLPPGLKMPDDFKPGPERRQLFEAYGRFVASLGGVYYTAEDVGTKTADMDAILSQNRFTTCISAQLGGSGNPSPFTARGVFRGMQAAWRFLTGADDLKGVRVAVQGAGNVGRPLIELLDDAGAQVWIADVYEPTVQALKAKRQRLQVASPEEIFDLDVDILAPCARGGVINSKSIPRLKARLICGAANNILLEERYDPERLRQRGISFVPDYVCNRMGITNCCDEWLGYLAEDIRVAAERVYPDTLRVLKHARHLSIPSLQAANELADIAASELHPILGHRGRRIIDHLMASNWSGAELRMNAVGPAPIFEPALDEPKIHVAWERQGRFNGDGLAITAAPISALSSPNLSSLLSPLLADVRSRALELLAGKRPRRILGSDHGGLALQLAIERFLPYEREEVGRAEFVAMCRDYYNRNDAAIRAQLHQLGVGFDPSHWLDTMSEVGKHVVNRLFFALQDAGLIVRENRSTYQCPRCQTVLVSPDVSRTKLTVEHHYLIRFKTTTGGVIETKTYFPELLLGAVAVAVKSDGPFSAFANQRALHPVSGKEIPVIAVKALGANAEFLVPAHHPKDEEIARSHGIAERIIVFDRKGAVSASGYANLSLEEVRESLLKQIEPSATRLSNHETIEAQRCRRCESIVHHNLSEQLFVKIETGIAHLRRAIESDAVRFSHESWRKHVLNYLDGMEPWCISRQQWWGNEIPTHRQEVLSTWFSLTAWSLQGAGWPQQANPAPINEVFVDPELLIRWIVPSQIVALMITGRPAFQQIHVHGSLHIVERQLKPRPGIAENAPDEERFLHSTVRRPMRLSFGNVVQPSTLIRRFGADALRLGYLLCVNIGPEKVATASESKLKQARKAIHLFTTKLTGIFHMLREPWHEGEARPADYFLLAQIRVAAEAARKAYEEMHFTAAAHIFVEAIETFSRYANVIAGRRGQGHDLGAVQATVAAVIAQMEMNFSPICPFVFEKIGQWMKEKYPASETASAVNSDLENLAELLSRSHHSRVEIESSKMSNLNMAESDRLEIERLAQKQILFK